MKFREIFRYELAYRLRSASTWIYAVILFLVAGWMFLGTADGVDSAYVNSPVRLAGAGMLVGMFGMLVTAALFGDAAVRDAEVEMEPLLFTTPLRTREYLGGRFLAALAVNALLLVAIPLGFLAATRFAASFETTGPFRIAAYVQPYLLFQLPNLVLVGTILFAIAVFARQAIPVYLGAIGLFIGYLVAANHWGHIENAWVSALADPLGIGALQELTRYWTAAEENDRLVGFPTALVWNRVVWLSVAAGVLAVLHRRFRFEHATGGGRRRGTPRLVAAPESGHASPVDVPRIEGSFGPGTAVSQTLAVARRSLAEAARSRWFVVVLLGCAGLTLLFGWNVGSTVFDTSTWPVTLLVAETVLTVRIAPIVFLLIALYAGELVWKEREVGAAEIADAAPVPDSVALLGRFLALVAMLAMIQLSFMIGGLLIQLLQGYYRFEAGLYLRTLFGLKLIDYGLFAALAMTVHVLVNQKYLGHILVLLLWVFTKAAPMMGIVRHHLLLYGTDPGWTYSDMNGFGPFMRAFLWFKLYWAAWALLLGVIAVLFRVRGREPGVRRRVRAARARFTGATVRAAVLAAGLILGFGGFIFYNTNILNEYRTERELGRPQAEYEMRYARYRASAQPVIRSAALRVEIYPDEPAVELRGSYRLVNASGTPIDSVHVTLDTDMVARSIGFDRAAKPVLVDAARGYRIYALERPLEPGGSVQLAFDVAFHPRGFRNDAMQTDVVGNGTNFNRRWLPFIGYQPLLELTGADARQQFDLPPRRPALPPEQAGERQERWPWRDADLVQVDAVIGTAADQVAVTIGELRRSWTERGRRYFHYRTAAPTAFGATIFSADYRILEDRWNDVELRIYHHPTHTDNLARMVRGMKASLAYYTAQFGPYPDRLLRIVEIPRYGGFGSAHPHTTAFAEDVFFSRVQEGEIDQPFYGTAHEVAHQWWGGQVRSAAGVRGAGFVSESLANYSAMMVTEKTYGEEVARRVYGFQMERYLRGRSSQAREVPLLQVEDQPYIAYRKGAIAMYTLREHIGEARVNTALRRFVEKHRDGRPPYPTSLDLYAELRAVTPDSLRSLLTDWFETVTLWDVGTKRAVAEPTGAGEYIVTLEVAAKKLRADSIGNETEVPMDDLVEIGIFAPGEGDAFGAPLHLARHRIRSGEQTLSIIVPGKPARAGIDPYRKLIDRADRPNVLDVAAAGSSR